MRFCNTDLPVGLSEVVVTLGGLKRKNFGEKGMDPGSPKAFGAG